MEDRYYLDTARVFHRKQVCVQWNQMQRVGLYTLKGAIHILLLELFHTEFARMWYKQDVILTIQLPVDCQLIPEIHIYS